MTAPDSTEFAFGQGVDFNVARNNNKQRIYGTGNRNAQATAALQYSVNLTANGTLSNAYWLLGAIGANADAGSGPTYTHTYTEEDRLPTFAAWARYEFDTSKNVLVQGVAINQVTLTTAVNETVKFSLECFGRYDGTNTDAESAVAETEKVYTFAGGVIETPTGTTIAKVQNLELTINNNIELVPEVGSRFAAAFVSKNREYGFRITVAITDFVLLSRLYDGTNTATEPGTDSGEIASMKLTFVNEDGYSIIFTFAGVHFNEDEAPGVPNEIVKTNITGWCHSLTDAVYTNGTETAPAEASNA